MKATKLGAIVCLLITQGVSAQAPMTPKVLIPSSERGVAAPSFGSWGNPACDKDGNMYFHAARTFTDAEIFRLSAEGNEGKIFKVSDQFPGAAKFIFSDFSVAPSGNVYVLGAVSRRQMLLRFDEDGRLDEPNPLQIPEGVLCDSIVATDSGTVLLFGYGVGPAHPELVGKSYLALVDASGAVRQELHVSVPGLDVAKLASGEGPSPGVSLGDDENLYLAGPNQILVVSLGGELLGRIPFDNPYPNSRVKRLQVSGGLILITLAHADAQGVLDLRYLALLNPSGAMVGYYEAPEGAWWTDVCYSAKQGITFLRMENRQVTIFTAPLN